MYKSQFIKGTLETVINVLNFQELQIVLSYLDWYCNKFGQACSNKNTLLSPKITVLQHSHDKYPQNHV